MVIVASRLSLFQVKIFDLYKINFSVCLFFIQIKDVINKGEFLRNQNDYINEYVKNDNIKKLIISWFGARTKNLNTYSIRKSI